MASRTDRPQPHDSDPLKNLKKDFERRIREIQEDLREGKSTAAEESLEYLSKELERAITELRDQLDETVKPGREAIRERPLLALGVAVGLGVLIGVLLGRRSKD